MSSMHAPILFCGGEGSFQQQRQAILAGLNSGKAALPVSRHNDYDTVALSDDLVQA